MSGDWWLGGWVDGNDVLRISWSEFVRAAEMVGAKCVSLGAGGLVSEGVGEGAKYWCIVCVYERDCVS